MGSTSVGIVEVGARDGLQNEKAQLTTAIKVELIDRAVAAGVRRLEATSFVNPARVPQMADAAEVLAAINGKPWRADVSVIGLALNLKGAERAIAAGCDEIGGVIVATNTFGLKNQGADIAKMIATWRDQAALAHARGVKPSLTISAAFGCPFEGEVAPEQVFEIARAVIDTRPSEIALADTIGCGVPSQVTRLLAGLKAIAPEVPLRAHFHNTRNTGIANAYAAVDAGVDWLDASVGGIGGCPFAPRATGNIPTEDLIYMLDRMGVATGVALDPMVEAGLWIEGQIGRPVPALLGKAGGFPAPAQQAAA